MPVCYMKVPPRINAVTYPENNKRVYKKISNPSAQACFTHNASLPHQVHLSITFGKIFIGVYFVTILPVSRKFIKRLAI